MSALTFQLHSKAGCVAPDTPGPRIVRVPGDKSTSHRALILASLATGTSRIRGLLDSADVRSTARCLRAMGRLVPDPGPDVDVAGSGRRMRVDGIASLDCGNSGTTARLLLGVAAAQHGSFLFDGDESLRRRPMERVTEPLLAMGAGVEWRSAAGRLPLRIVGQVNGLGELHYEMKVASAQVKSAILLAGVCGGVRVAVREPLPSRDHTERMLCAMGVAVRSRDGWLVLDPVSQLPATDFIVPGDPSSAAFLAALGVLGKLPIVIPDVLANDARIGFVDVMKRMGAGIAFTDLREEGGEVIGTLRVSPSELNGVGVEPNEVPGLIDEIPVLSVLAARAQGVTTVRGASELRAKESDRIATMVAGLRAVGVEAAELPDGLVVQGTRSALRGRVETQGDHRVAMAFAVLGASPGVDIAVDDLSSADVSFPGFNKAIFAALNPSGGDA
ncbi:MAG: 3-phosphoshikimate 1-carboxyvinyltransferase [Gemmatimonadota bacterium]